MANYNVEFNRFNGAEYDTLLPKTSVENVIGLTSTAICTITPALTGVTVTLKNGANIFTGITNSSGIATINVPVFGTYAITFDNQYVTTSPTSVGINAYGIYPINAIYFVGVTYTVKIDETNSNPETALVYQDDAVGMVKGSSAWDSKDIFKDIKPCVFKDGLVNYYLNPNNYNKKIDGSSSILSGADGDVMVEFSKFAYRIYREGNYLYVSITNDPAKVAADNRFKYLAFSRDAEGDRDKMYVGAYHGYESGSKLHSITGPYPTVSQTISTFRAQAQANGVGYQQFTFYQLTALQCLYIIKYGNLNCQSALGRGYNQGSGRREGGTLNSNGMYYGVTTDNTQSMKFAGIEDLWGNVYDWIDGIVTDESRNILTGFTNYNNTGTGYINNGQGSLTNIAGYISKTQGTKTSAGFVIKESSGSGGTYFASYAALDGSCIPYFGASYQSTSAYASIFQLRIHYTPTQTQQYIGARLTYV